jgi:hypothetical protein
MTTEASIPSQTLLEAIDVQQSELLDQLEALNARIERVLKECLPRELPLRILASRPESPA